MSANINVSPLPFEKFSLLSFCIALALKMVCRQDWFHAWHEKESMKDLYMRGPRHMTYAV